MRGANNLQRQLAVLAQKHGVSSSSPCRVPLTAPPEHPTLILEGIASTSAIDVDRVSFAPFCFGASLPASLPLLIEHDRPAGTAVVNYDSQGGLRVRTSPLTGEARLFGAFSPPHPDCPVDLVGWNRIQPRGRRAAADSETRATRNQRAAPAFAAPAAGLPARPHAADRPAADRSAAPET